MKVSESSEAIVKEEEETVIRNKSFFFNGYIHEMKTLEHTILKLFCEHATDKKVLIFRDNNSHNRLFKQ